MKQLISVTGLIKGIIKGLIQAPPAPQKIVNTSRNTCAIVYSNKTKKVFKTKSFIKKNGK
jgi:hypothetical protein